MKEDKKGLLLQDQLTQEFNKIDLVFFLFSLSKEKENELPQKKISHYNYQDKERSYQYLFYLL